MRLVYFVGCILVFLSCARKPKEITQEVYPKLKLESGIVKLDDAYAANPLDVENFKSMFSNFRLRKEPIQNTYTANQIDTIFHLSNGMDSLKIYQAASKKFLLSMNILTKRVHLNREIFLGMSKEDFYHRFEALDSIEVKPDSILIWMTTSRLDFLFRADTLSHITWEAEID